MLPGTYDESSREKWNTRSNVKNINGWQKRIAKKEMDMKQRKLDMEHEQHKAAMEALQATST